MEDSCFNAKKTKTKKVALGFYLASNVVGLLLFFSVQSKCSKSPMRCYL